MDNTAFFGDPNTMNVEHFWLSKSDWVPNNPNFPVVLYRQIGPDTDTCAFEEMFSTNGWTDIWRNGVFDYHHYHSRAHEVLGVGGGHAKLQIGGSDGPVLEVSKGDCLILPAGTGHKNLECSSDFLVVGAYPPGQEADIQRSHPTNDMLTTIHSLPPPKTDPVQGSSGALLELWCDT